LTENQPEKPTRYKVVADELRAAITAGTYPPGAKLPSETDLMSQHDISRGTAREALGLLRAEGLVESRRGSGVYVRNFTRIPRNATKRLSSSVWGVGRSIWGVDLEERPLAVINLVVEEVVPEARIAACFGLTAGEKVWKRDRDFVAEGRAVQRATSYIPSTLAAGTDITRREAGPGGTFARLAEVGHAPVRFREELQCRMPLEEEITRLRLGAGTPVILIARTAFDANEQPVEVTEMVLDSSSYLLQYDFTA
jgi:GntR family transcriptional regulator